MNNDSSVWINVMNQRGASMKQIVIVCFSSDFTMFTLVPLQFRYKSRVYKHTNVNEMLIAKINIQVSIKKCFIIEQASGEKVLFLQ